MSSSGRSPGEVRQELEDRTVPGQHVEQRAELRVVRPARGHGPAAGVPVAEGGGEPEGAGADALVEDRAHLGDLVGARRALGARLAHHEPAQDGVTDQSRDVQPEPLRGRARRGTRRTRSRTRERRARAPPGACPRSARRARSRRRAARPASGRARASSCPRAGSSLRAAGVGSQSGSQNREGSTCAWFSMNPGATVAPAASISGSPSGRRSGPTSAMLPPRTRTSAARPGDPVPSTTVPPRTSRSAIAPGRPQPVADRQVLDAADLVHPAGARRDRRSPRTRAAASASGRGLSAPSAPRGPRCRSAPPRRTRCGDSASVRSGSDRARRSGSRRGSRTGRRAPASPRPGSSARRAPCPGRPSAPCARRA